jgi:hypothetical protein
MVRGKKNHTVYFAILVTIWLSFVIIRYPKKKMHLHNSPNFGYIYIFIFTMML